MFKKSLALVLGFVLILSSITCLFTANVLAADGDNLIITPTAVTSLSKATTPASRETVWLRNSGGSAGVSTENGELVAYRKGYAGGHFFTNTFKIEKNSKYLLSFEVKGSSANSYSYNTTASDGSTSTYPRGIDFALHDFAAVDSSGAVAYTTAYREGRSDYAHTSKYSNKRSDFSCVWTIELPDGSTESYKSTKYSSFGRKIGTTEASSDLLKSVNLDDLYSDWRTVTCEITIPDGDEYSADEIALAFVLPSNATEVYVKNASICKDVPKEPVPTSVPTVVVDAEGNAHKSAEDLGAFTSVTDNGNDTYTLNATFDDMDGVNEFVGFYEGEKLLSNESTLTVDDKVDLKNVTAKILCNSVITGGLGFESYKEATSLRVDPSASRTPPYDDKWGINYKEYEYGDIDFTLSTVYGDFDTQYTPSYDAESASFNKATITVKPYSGNAMFRYSARYRVIVRKLDNLSPNTKYNLSFYLYNSSQWDFLSKAYIADSYLLPNGTSTSTNDITVYTKYSAKTSTDEYGKTVLANDNEVRNWHKITLEFTTDEDDTELYLYFDQIVGNNSSSTSRMFFDNFTCAPVPAELPNITEVPLSVVDTNGYAHPSPKEISATTTAVYNDDDTITVSIDYDDMDTINVFKGWYEGDKFLSSDTTYTLGADVNEHKVKAKILCRSVITGGMGFESYKELTSLRVSATETDNKLENIPPFDDRWGQIYNSYQQTSDYAFDIKASYGDVRTKYAPTINAETGKWNTDYITVKPRSGNSMFYFAARFRTIVRKLDNLKPNTNYQLSFYTYNLTEWDFLNTAVIADSYLLKNGYTTSKDGVNVYSFYKAATASRDGDVVLADENQVRNWSKITINFTTDSDDTELYLHLKQEVGNNSGSTSKQFIDDLTCTETVIGYAGNAIRAKNESKPQALRYKFFIDNAKLSGFSGMTTSKIGLLAVKNEVFGDDTLEIGKKYTHGGEEYDVIDVTVNPETNFQYVDGDIQNTYFTAALYNIGAKGNSVDYDAFTKDYSVRPYVIYKDENGSEMLIYGDTVGANVFNVMYAIVRDNTSDEDVATVKSMLQNEKLGDKYFAWQPTNSWYIGESQAKDYAFSFAVVGDTQKTTGYYPDKLHYTYDWILDNAESKNIQYVMGLGDITEWLDPKTEWPLAMEQLERLEAAGINQSIVRGNHDGSSYFDQHVTMDKFGSKLTGSYDNTMKNTYRLITINGIKYMMLTLNLFPSNDEVAWAEQVIASHPDYNVILTTHAYFDHDMSLTNDDDIDWVSDRVPEGEEATLNSGEEIFDKLVNKYSNIVLVMCGHRYPPDNGPNYRITTRADGSKVMEMMINPQRMESEGGRSYGMLAMLYISEDGRSVQLEYFSTISGMFYMDKFQFEFTLDLVD